jgi:periplasmic divalent cation tolerance protein
MEKRSEYQLLLTTCPNQTIAEKLGHGLVKKRLAACVNIIPQVRSIYEWQGNVASENEVLLLIKTQQKHYTAIEELLIEQHPYEVPELLALPIEGGFDKYLAWLNNAVK